MKAGNISVRNEEIRTLDVTLRSHMTASINVVQDLGKYSSLSESEALGTLPSLDIVEETLRVVLELTKDETPLVRKKGDTFVEVDADGNYVIDGDTGEPKIAIDPKALEWETKAAVL